MTAGKTTACRIHAKRRALQRYDTKVNRNGIREAVRQIQQQEATFVERQSLRLSCWRVVLDGKPMTTIYDKKRKTIVTFLPPDDRRHRKTSGGCRIARQA